MEESEAPEIVRDVQPLEWVDLWGRRNWMHLSNATTEALGVYLVERNRRCHIVRFGFTR